MAKYLYAENVTEEELSELQNFKKKGSREFVRGRITRLWTFDPTLTKMRLPSSTIGMTGVRNCGL